MMRRARPKPPEAFADQVDDAMLFDGVSYRRVTTVKEIQAGLDVGMALTVRDARGRASPFVVLRPHGTAYRVCTDETDIGAFVDLSAAVTAGLKHGLGAGMEH